MALKMSKTIDGFCKIKSLQSSLHKSGNAVYKVDSVQVYTQLSVIMGKYVGRKRCM